MSLFTGPSSSSATRIILTVTLIHLVIGVFVHGHWLATGDQHALRMYFDYEGAIVFLFLSVAQLLFASLAYKEFSAAQPLGSAWFYIVAASLCALIGTILTKLLTVDSAINPINYVVSGSTQSLRSLLGSIGAVLGGPVYLILLGTGLYFAIRVYRQLGLTAKPKPVDFLLVGGALLYTLVVIIGVVRTIKSHPEGVTAEHALTWPGDYLLSLLLLEAIVLRRAAVEMGNGFVSKVWSAFVFGIFLTSFCSLINWVTAYGFIPWTYTSFVWYLWYPASAAFALAPAIQWEATRTARLRLSKRIEELELPA